MRYATSVPTWIWPEFDAAGADPQHARRSTALMRKLTVGNIDDISRPARSDTSVRSALASSNRRALLRLAHERPHHPDAGDLLAQHPVDLVDALLHQPERRHHPRHEQAEHDRRRPASRTRG